MPRSTQGGGHKRLEGNDPHGCRWEKCSPQLSRLVLRRCPPRHRHHEGHSPLPSPRDLGAEDEVPVAGPSERDVGCRSASGLVSYLWRWRAALQNEESRASFQLWMQTAGCLQNDFSRFGAAGRSCETSWLNQACADTMRAGSRGAGWRWQGKAVGLSPGEQSPLQEGEDSLNLCPFNTSCVDDL